jgi:DNA-binding transcriptional ArsR family regulator
MKRDLSYVAFLLGNEHCVCEFVDITGKGQTTISRHLKILTEAGIIKQERRSRNVICSIKDDKVRNRLEAMGIKGRGSCCGDEGAGKALENDTVKQIPEARR